MNAPDSRQLALIVAIGENGAIGMAGRLPWDHAEDRAFFASTTRGHAVIMGRRTWEETGGPLKGRENIVVSRTLRGAEGAHVVPDLDSALELAWSLDPEPFVIGGTRLFSEAMPRVTHAFVTTLPISPEADTFFCFDTAGFRLVGERALSDGARIREYERERSD